jgi:outer membrane biosynthesis protein TonB
MERGSYIASALLHVGVIVLVVTGLPSLFKPPEPEEMPIAVELVNIAEQTRSPTPNPTPPKPEAKPEPQVAEAPPAPPKPEPPKPEPPPPPPPAPSAPPPPPPPAPEPPPKPPEPKPEPPKPEPPKPEPPKAEPPKPKPQPPKQVAEAPRPKKKPEPPKKEPEKFDVNAVLKTLKQSAPAPKTEEPPKKQPEAAPQVASAAPLAPLAPQLTTSEIDLIRRQIAECWNPPIGAKDAKDLVVEVYVAANPDGTIRDARVVSAHGSQETFVQAAADSALRAVRNPRCTPLKLPPEKYERWKTFTLVFTPRDML